MKLFQIISAYIKWIGDILKGTITEEAIDRYETCRKCKHSKLGICQKCGCVIRVKTNMDYIIDEDGKALDGCPLKKW